MIQLSCKTCGASLRLDLTKPKVICEYCRTEYLVEQLLTERRINDLDGYNKLEPIAYNAYRLHNYPEAVKLYENLMTYGQNEVDIARYNICCLAMEYIKPTDEFFKSISCIEELERYEHIRSIKKIVENIVNKKTKEVLSNFRGMQRVKAIYNISKWYKPYKYMMDEVIPLECSCGRVLGRGENTCGCGMKRKDLLNFKRGRRRAVRFALILSICTFITLGIKFIIYHSI